MSLSFRALSAALSAASVCCATASCSGSAPGVAITTVSRQTTTKPAPLTPGRRPAAAADHTSEGARALAAHYLQARNQAFTTPDPLLLSGLGTDECTGCRQDVATARELREHHLRYDAAPFTVIAATTGGEASGDRVVVDVVLQREPAHVRDRDGRVTSTVVRARLGQQVELRWTPDGWYVHAVTTQQP